MQTSIIPLFWEENYEEIKLGKLLIELEGEIGTSKFKIKLIIVDRLSQYKVKETASILSIYMKKYPVEYFEQIVPIISSQQGFSKSLRYFLVCQIENPQLDDENEADSNLLTNSALKALQLCSSFGILSHTRFLLPNLERPGELVRATTRGGVISISATDRGLIRLYPDITMHHYQISNNWKDIDKFTTLVSFFNRLQTMENDEKTSFHKISELVIDLFLTVMSVRNYRPKYLILEVIYETIFKEENDRIQQMATKISKFLDESDEERQQLKETFHVDDPQILTVGRLRNKIAHGDLDIQRNDLKFKY